MTDHAPMKLEKHYTWWIERRWHIPNKPPFTRLATSLLVSNAWIQHKIVQYWWWFLSQWCRDVASGAYRHLYIGLQVVEAHPLFPYFLEKRSAIPTSPFFSTSWCCCCCCWCCCCCHSCCNAFTYLFYTGCIHEAGEGNTPSVIPASICDDLKKL